MIYFTRLIISTCILTVLVKANVWINPICNIVLVVGYRSFLLFSPIFSKITKKFSLPVALLFASAGSLLFCFHHGMITFCAAVFLSLGVSIASYLIRFHASHTTHGAAYNKIAANIGGITSGVILLFLSVSETIFFKYLSLAFFIAAMTSLSCISQAIKIKPQHLPNFKIDKIVGWFLLGMSVGIFIFGCKTTLPQYIIMQLHDLPRWYGLIVIVNCLLVVLFQLKIIHAITKYKNPFLLSVVITTIGLLIVAFPALFHPQLISGALLWIFIYTLIECVISFFDVYSKKNNMLLVKEAAVGLGGGLSVLMMRIFTSDYSTVIIGSFGIVCIFIASQLILNEPKHIKNLKAI